MTGMLYNKHPGLTFMSGRLKTLSFGGNSNFLDIEVLLHHELGDSIDPFRGGILAMIGASVFFICGNAKGGVLLALRNDIDDAEDLQYNHHLNAAQNVDAGGDENGPKDSSASFYRVLQPKTLQQVMELISKPGIEEAYRKQLLVLERFKTTVVDAGSYVVV